MIDLDVARKDELSETFTSQDIEDIKAEIDIPRANVNIVPYEIYDEDGEEIVVGEVRKTIDGVKKKKPLYRKIVDFGAISVSASNSNLFAHNISDIDAIKNYDASFILDGFSGIAKSPFMRGYSVGTYSFCVINVDNTNVNIRATESRPNTEILDFTAIIDYTKTTDEWEVVE